MLNRYRTIDLISVTVQPDAIGQQINAETVRTVMARMRSVSLNEWTSVRQLGHNAEYQALVFFADYEGEEIAEVDGKRYHIYRTYNNGDYTELYMEEMIGHD